GDNGQAPTLAITASSNVSCSTVSDGSATIGATPAAQSPFVYSWPASLGLGNVNNAANLMVGSYMVTVADNIGCIDSIQVTIGNNNQVPVITLANSANVSCVAVSNGSATVNAGPVGQGPFNYAWPASLAAGNVPNVNNLGMGSYTVTVTDNMGCVDSLAITIGDDNDIPVINDVVTDASCAQSGDGSITVSSSGGGTVYTYTWQASMGVGNVTTVNNLNPGTYSVTSTDNIGCSGTLVITVGDANNYPIGNIVNQTDATCSNTVDGTGEVGALNGTSPYTYTWSNGTIGAIANGLAPGTYSITISDSKNCNDTISMTIGAPVPPVVSTSQDTTICIGGTATLTANATGGNSPYTFEWIGQGLNQTVNVTPTIPTNYEATVRDANNCPGDTANVQVMLYPGISAAIPDPGPVCQGDSIQILANANGGNGVFQYSWSNGDNGNPIWIKPPDNAVLYVTITNVGCETPGEVDSVNVYVASYPPVQFYSDKASGCPPLSLNFISTDVKPMYKYLWDFGDGTQIFSLDDTIQHVYGNSGYKTVSLSVTSDSGCISILEFDSMIHVFDQPEAKISYTPNNPSNINPRVYLIDRSTGATNWEWLVDSSDIYIQENVSHDFEEVGVHDVRLVVANNLGCRDTTRTKVFVITNSVVYVPNTFTPNGDGYNDEFGPVGEGFGTENFEMYIFNRWGDPIYSTTSITAPWNGKVGNVGAVVQDGLYLYKIIYRDHEQREQQIVGHVYLMGGF
ncbi:MAG: PKD domain-containing protein, partial [Flavobacteriales bacterium]|nr:PKD domain-containing protein [Flavobacteriales bacterium]